MKFSYNWLKELAGFADDPQELAGFLTLRVFEVESVEKTGEDWTLDIKILPNRIADASGHAGLAREIAALKNSRFKVQSLKFAEDRNRKAADTLRVKIENPEDCPRYTARVMDGVKVGESPTWLRERLEVCGLQSINNIVDTANYVMLETGQPLHVFDFDRLHAKDKKTITVRRAEKGERMPALDDKTYALNPDILVIADGQESIAIAGIKGGKHSGVSSETRTIVLESANFDQVRIRAGSRALNLRTDASHRFEHGLDPNQTAAAVDRLAQFIQQVAGGIILAGTVDAYPKKIKGAAILFRPAYAERLIGAKIPASFYKDAFRRLGWTAKSKGRDFVVMPPTARRDIQIEEDVIEEVARLFDYANVAPQMPHALLASPESNDEIFWEERAREFLIGAGFTESHLYEFTGEKELETFRISKENLLALENPANPEMAYLTPRLMAKYVVSAAENLRGADTVAIFGIGKSFERAKSPESGTQERKDLVLVRAEKSGGGGEEFYQLKGTLDLLLESLGVSDHWYDDVPGREPAPRDKFHPYRFVEIKVGDEKIGHIGEIHPDILRDIKAKARIIAAEIYMTALARLASAESEFRPIGKYPSVIRDIAVVVPAGTRTQDIENTIQAAGGGLLADTDLFDYFQDAEMRDAEEKSVAFHLVFQSTERTLTDTEIDAIIKKITAALEEKGWEMRK